MPAAPELPGGTVTFLFTDIEGSTRLLEQRGRERYGELLARHNELLRSAFASNDGIEVDRNGDAFFAVFRSAGAAVRAAADAQRALAAEHWPAGAPVRVRMGLHTGEASVGEGGYVGFAIHLAAHVGAAARGGQTLLTSTVAKIVEHELPTGGRLRDLGERSLKRLERPERLYALELADLPHTVSPDPTPARVDGRRAAPLLERDADLAALRALLDAARDGNGTLAVIEGSAGIGKTRLLGETRAIGAQMGLRVLSARGGELEREYAFGLVRQLFEPLVATASAQERAELFAGAAGLAAPLFGEAGLDEAPAGDVSFAILHGLYWLTVNAALHRPALLLVDDVHWGDAPSLRWLTFIVRRLDGLPLMLAVGTRPPEQSEQGALLTELLADPAAVVLRPGTLGSESVAVLGRDVFAAKPDAQFCEACRAATGGNPLYLRALLITLAGEGFTPTAEACARVDEVGPEPVARAVSLRLSRLPREATAVAEAIAVLGQGAELGIAAAVAGLERPAAVAASAALARAELVRLEPVLEFAHPVMRASIYQGIGVIERADAHRRAARFLSEAGAEPEQTASHLLLIQPAHDPFVTPILREAARRAAARGAADAAVTYLRRAPDEPPPAAERADVLDELGLVEMNVDAPAAIEHLREAVRLVEEENRFIEIALDCGRVLAVTANNADAIEVLTALIERAGPARRDLAEEALGDLISATWWEPEFYPRAKELLSELREDDLVGGLGTDVLRATLA